MKQTFILCMFSVLLAASAVLGYTLAYSYILNLRDRVFAEESKASERKLQESREGSVRQLYMATAEDRATLARYFVGQQEVAGIVERLERLGKESGVEATVSGIGIGAGGVGAAEARVRPVDISVQAVGSRFATEEFLQRVEIFPYVLSVEEVSLEKLLYGASKEERWRLAVSLRIGIRN